MAISKTFGNVTVAAIDEVKNPTPGAKHGMVVVYTQSLTTEYNGTATQSAAKASLGIAAPTTQKNYEGRRKFREFWSDEELASANGGIGLNVGDQVGGVAISNLRSTMPFFAGQQPFALTGLYYSPLIEATNGDQPDDRQVDNSHLPHNVAAALAGASLDKQPATVPATVEVE